MSRVQKLIDGLECESILSLCKSPGDIPYWFLIRNSVLHAFIGRDMYQSSESFYGRPAYRALYFFESFIHFIRTFWKLFAFRKANILIFPSEAGFFCENKGILKNRYVDEFINADQSISYLVLGSTIGVSKGTMVGLPTHYISMSFIDFLIKLWGYIFQAIHMRTARSFIEEINSRHCELFGSSLNNVELNKVAKQLAVRLASRRIETAYYRFLLTLFKPVALLYEEGHYQHRVVLTRVAFEMGVKSIEYQHGLIHHSHVAYNFSQAVRAGKNYVSLLPKFLLTYGPYWHQFCNTPSILISIGNPYRESRITENIRKLNVKSTLNRILVLGDGIDTERYLKLSSELSKAMGILGKVIFRPHPLERNFIQSLINIYKYDFEIDQNEDLYSTLVTVDTVVSEMSTVLFEATGIVTNVISIAGIKSENYYRNIPFESVNCSSDIVKRLLGECTQASHTIQNDFWGADWKTSYQIFIKKIVSNTI
jgi:hypothetical protein